MKIRTALLAAALFATSAAALAQTAAISRNATIQTADGVIIGRVDRVISDHGTMTGVQLIVGSRMVRIPADKISVDAQGVKTTLTRKEVRTLP